MTNRIEMLRQKMSDLGIDAFLVSNFYNIFYLSGFKGLSPEEREAWMLVAKNNCYFFTDGRYEESAIQSLKSIKSESRLKLLNNEKNLTKHIAEIANVERTKSASWRIGFEASDLIYAEYERITKYLPLFSTDKIIIAIREIKDETEIASIKKACEYTDDCLTQIVSSIRPGIAEFEIAYKIEQYLRERRLDVAFYPIVAVDKNAALPHYDTKLNGNTKIRKNSLVLIDFGARYNNYLADMTRIIFVGQPQDAVRNAYTALLETQEKTIEQLQHSTDPKEIDTFCRDSLIEKSYPSFPHSTGHGVGLEIHEYPKISSKSTDTLRRGQVLTIEPGIYMHGAFGMRIEDTVFIKEDKTPEVLTKFPKEMLVI